MGRKLEKSINSVFFSTNPAAARAANRCYTECKDAFPRPCGRMREMAKEDIPCAKRRLSCWRCSVCLPCWHWLRRAPALIPRRCRSRPAAAAAFTCAPRRRIPVATSSPARGLQKKTIICQIGWLTAASRFAACVPMFTAREKLPTDNLPLEADTILRLKSSVLTCR